MWWPRRTRRDEVRIFQTGLKRDERDTVECAVLVASRRPTPLFQDGVALCLVPLFTKDRL